MALVNEQFLKLPESYLFTEIARKVNAFKLVHPRCTHYTVGYRRCNTAITTVGHCSLA